MVAMLMSLPMVVACFSYPVIGLVVPYFGHRTLFLLLSISLVTAVFYIGSFFFREERILFLFLAVFWSSLASIFISWLRENIAMRTGNFGMVRAANCGFIAMLLYLMPKFSDIASDACIILGITWIAIGFMFFFFVGDSIEYKSVGRNIFDSGFLCDFWRLLPYCLVLASNAPLDLYGAIEWSKSGSSSSEIGLFWLIGLASEFFVFYYARRVHSELICVITIAFFSVLRWSLMLRGGGSFLICVCQLLHGLTYALPLVISMRIIGKCSDSGMLVAKFLTFQFGIQAAAMLLAGFAFKHLTISPWFVAMTFALVGSSAWLRMLKDDASTSS